MRQVVQVAKALVGDEAAVLRAEEARCSAEAKGSQGTSSSVLWATDKRGETCAAFMAAPRFILLDFRRAHPLPAACLVLLVSDAM